MTVEIKIKLKKAGRLHCHGCRFFEESDCIIGSDYCNLFYQPLENDDEYGISLRCAKCLAATVESEGGDE